MHLRKAVSGRSGTPNERKCRCPRDEATENHETLFGDPRKDSQDFTKVGDPQIADGRVKGYWITPKKTAQETRQQPPWERV